MNESTNSGKSDKITYTATLEGLERAEQSLKRLGFGSKSNFASSALISRSTVTKFFTRKPIQFDSFIRICESLKLSDWKEIAGIKIKELSEPSKIKYKSAEYSLYHPLTHYINSERLYYILVTFNYDVLQEAKKLSNELPNLIVSNAISLFSIYGDIDLLIRVWCTDEEINNIDRYLKNNIKLKNHQLIIINKSYLWYQKKLEKNEKLRLERNVIEDLLIGKIDQSLIFNASDINYSFRFWMFIQVPEVPVTASLLNFDLFDEFFLKLQSLENDPINLNIKHTFNISIYSYETNGFNNIIIRSDSNDFHISANSLYDIASSIIKDHNLDFKVTTYIERKLLYEASYKFNPVRFIELPPGERKRETIYNLSKLYNCNKIIYQSSKTNTGNFSLNIINTFSSEISSLFYEIFAYENHSLWYKNVKKIRTIFQFVVESKNQELKSLIIFEYIIIEKKLREVIRNIEKEKFDDTINDINGFNKIIKEISHKLNHKLNREQIKIDDTTINQILSILKERGKAFSEHITFGEMSTAINIISSRNYVKLNQNEIKYLKEFSEKINYSVKDRNYLVHGTIIDLFENWEWIKYVTNFLRLYLAFPYALEILEKLL
jgi:hypothetical protein